MLHRFLTERIAGPEFSAIAIQVSMLGNVMFYGRNQAMKLVAKTARFCFSSFSIPGRFTLIDSANFGYAGGPQGRKPALPRFCSSHKMRLNKEQMQCMEILGGNLATDKAFEGPGLDIYINSRPHQESETGGGDVYYVTNCASGRVTRLLLADVSGHGSSVAGLANSLKNSLQQNANTISQSRFVRQMNHEFQKLSESNEKLATAVVATYFETQKRLALGMAGHPNPLLFRASDQLWHKVDEQASCDTEQRYRNMPLGIVQDSIYPTRNLPIEVGDMALLYSDAFIESMSGDSRYLGIEGVLDILNRNHRRGTKPAHVIPELQKSIRMMSPTNLDEDDATVMLIHFTDKKPRLRDTLAAPFRLMRNVRDRTSFLHK